MMDFIINTDALWIGRRGNGPSGNGDTPGEPGSSSCRLLCAVVRRPPPQLPIPATTGLETPTDASTPNAAWILSLRLSIIYPPETTSYRVFLLLTPTRLASPPARSGYTGHWRIRTPTTAPPSRSKVLSASSSVRADLLPTIQA